MWHELRLNRPTASLFGDVINRKSAPSDAFLKSLFSARNLSNVASTAHESEKEDPVRKRYTTKILKVAKHAISVFGTELLNKCIFSPI